MFSASHSIHVQSSMAKPISQQTSSSNALVLFFYFVTLNILVATKLSVMPFPEKALPSQTLFASVTAAWNLWEGSPERFSDSF